MKFDPRNVHCSFFFCFQSDINMKEAEDEKYSKILKMDLILTKIVLD